MTRKLIHITKYLSAGILCLGVIHEVATFTPLIRDGLETLSVDNLKAVIYNSLISGASLILCGSLLFFCLKRYEQYHFLSFPILLLSFFVLLDGVLAVVYMPDNPFAWIVLVLGILVTGISWITYNLEKSGK